MEKGLYIVFEGGEGVGKTTQTRRVAREIGALSVAEPGTTPVGTEIRSILLNPNLSKEPMTEVLLHAAQRAELMQTEVEPALRRGRHVVSDRSWISSMAYQSAQGVEIDAIEIINQHAIGLSRMSPDVLILLDADPAAIRDRQNRNPDYYEAMEQFFHEKVRENFLDIGFRFGAFVVDATQHEFAVGREVDEIIQGHL